LSIAGARAAKVLDGSGTPFDRILLVESLDFPFLGNQRQVDLEYLGQPGFGEDLVPLRIHDLPLGDQVGVLRLAIHDLKRCGRAVQRKDSLAHLLR
jgi:hypothetical protein